jgi:hypothetical protein
MSDDNAISEKDSNPEELGIEHDFYCKFCKPLAIRDRNELIREFLDFLKKDFWCKYREVIFSKPLNKMLLEEDEDAFYTTYSYLMKEKIQELEAKLNYEN